MDWLILFMQGSEECDFSMEVALNLGLRCAEIISLLIGLSVSERKIAGRRSMASHLA